jgi:hypothetical protein
MHRSMVAGAPLAPRPPLCRPSRRLPTDSRPQVTQIRLLVLPDSISRLAT